MGKILPQKYFELKYNHLVKKVFKIQVKNTRLKYLKYKYKILHKYLK